jgi:hypothetical protein
MANCKEDTMKCKVLYIEWKRPTHLLCILEKKENSKMEWIQTPLPHFKIIIKIWLYLKRIYYKYVTLREGYMWEKDGKRRKVRKWIWSLYIRMNVEF